jgi:hypothetical protein
MLGLLADESYNRVIVNYFTNPLIIFNEAKHEYW